MDCADCCLQKSSAPPHSLRVLGSIMVESSCCFQNSNRNSACRPMVTLPYTHCRELMKSLGGCRSGGRERKSEHASSKGMEFWCLHQEPGREVRRGAARLPT